MKKSSARGGTTGGQRGSRTASERGAGPIFRVDRMRVWSHKPGEFTAHTELRAREGEIFVVQVIALEAHPMPKANRRGKVRGMQATAPS